jgi:hypothetical protein
MSTEAENRLRKAFDDAVESLVNELGKESGKGKDQREKARKAITKNEGIISAAEKRIPFLENALEEWQEFLDEPGTPTPREYHLAWRNIFGESSGFVKGTKSQQWWDENSKAGGEADLVKAGNHFRAKVAEMEEQISDVQPGKISKAETQIVNAESAIASIEETSNRERGPAREARQAAIDLGENPSETDIINWMLDRGFDTELDEIVEIERFGAEGLNARTESFEGRLGLAETIADVKKQRDVVEPGELGGRDTIRPEADVLSDSERVREGLDSVETGDPETSNPFQAGLDEELALQRVQRENRGRDRGFDESLQEFGPPVDETETLNPVEGDTRVNPNTGLTEKYIGGEWVAGSEGEDGEWIPGGTTEREILQGIGETFDVAAQFGYRFFFFEPGTQNPREDMLITDPKLLAEGKYTEPVNVLQYIKDRNLSDPNEIRAAFSTTKWFADTNETMQQFDLEWSAAASPGSLNDEITLRRRELIADQENYIRDQLALLGLEDKVTEDQITDLAILAKRTGMDNQAVRQTMTDVNSEFLNFTSFAGEMDTGLLGVYKSGVENMAGQYMIGLSDASIDEWVTGMFESEDPELQLALYREEMQQLAKERFPTIGGLIDQGMTPKQYFAPYKDKAELLLERPVDFMGGDANWFDKIANGTPDNETGSRVMTYTEANKYVRGLPEWQTTKNANDEAREIADNIGRMFGFVA